MAAGQWWGRGKAAAVVATLDGLEKEVLAHRRAVIATVVPPARPAPNPLPPAQPCYRALALSGGGIRSATFALGVLQAVARDRNPAAVAAAVPELPSTAFVRSRLSCFDYLSTVSGGGYTGAFLCSLFMPNRLRSHDGLARSDRHAQHGTGIKGAAGWVWSLVKSVLPGRANPPLPAAAASALEVDAGDTTGNARTSASAAAQAPAPDLRLKAANDAVRVLTAGPPERIRSDRDYAAGAADPAEADPLDKPIHRAPLAWLRENGRYLVPTGAGDAFYAAALGVRNWLALHYVIGTVLMAAVALVGLARMGAAMGLSPVMDWERDSLKLAVQAFDALKSPACLAATPPSGCAWGIGLVWWSPLLPLSLAPLVAGVPLGVAFWLVHEREDGRSWPVNIAMLCTLGIGVTLLALSQQLWPHFASGLWRSWTMQEATIGRPLASLFPLDRRVLTLTVAAMAVVAPAVYVWVALVDRSAGMQRVLLTRRLADALVLAAVIAGIGVVDTLGQTLYLALTTLEGARAPALVPAGLAMAISWLARRIGAMASPKDKPAWWKKLPLTTLAGGAGVLVFVLIGGLWSLLVHWIVWNGRPPTPDGPLHGPGQLATLGWVLAVIMLLAVVAGHFAAFINLSSLQAFYGSRLTRAYLGASNGERFENGRAALSAAEPLPGDQLAMDDYYDAAQRAPKTLAPLHLINITVNKTVDPAEQLVQRDRKGLPMAVLPMGFSIDERSQVGYPRPSLVNGVRRPLPVGQWVGTSGAAFSTGIGRETSLGMSLLMGAANVRLGTWWESGLSASTAGTGHNPATLLRQALGALFRTQTYLSYELRARFHGTQRRWQYLSDGGHFENTGLYELLRRERRVAQVFCCDAGADPLYQFDDLANLIRLARIDLRVEVTVQTAFEGVLATVFGAPKDFKPKAAAGAAAAGAHAVTSDSGPVLPPTPTPCALLLWARHFDDPAAPVTQIVVIKPRITRDVPVDICQYADRQPQFPQQTTADQFFDEAQWESHRALGYHLGAKVFDPAVMAALERLRRQVSGVDI